MPRQLLSPQVRTRVRKVQCILLDVDGVLTDGKLYKAGDGSEWKAFDIRDGAGIKLAQVAGLTVGWISSRPSKATANRAKELAVKWLFQGSHDKRACVTEIQQKAGFTPEQTCFVGDDLIDVPAMRMVGFPVAVADAVAEVRAVARYVTRAKGGKGAVREVIELILKTQGIWHEVLNAYWQRSSSPRQ